MSAFLSHNIQFPASIPPKVEMMDSEKKTEALAPSRLERQDPNFSVPAGETIYTEIDQGWIYWNSFNNIHKHVNGDDYMLRILNNNEKVMKIR